MKAYGGCRGTAPLILIIVTGRRWVVQFIPVHFTPRRGIPYPLTSKTYSLYIYSSYGIYQHILIKTPVSEKLISYGLRHREASYKPVNVWSVNFCKNTRRHIYTTVPFMVRAISIRELKFLQEYTASHLDDSTLHGQSHKHIGPEISARIHGVTFRRQHPSRSEPWTYRPWNFCKNIRRHI